MNAVCLIRLHLSSSVNLRHYFNVLFQIHHAVFRCVPTPHFEHHFPAPCSGLPQLVTPLKGHYLRAAVHRCCHRPPKGLGTNKNVEATLPPQIPPPPIPPSSKTRFPAHFLQTLPYLVTSFNGVAPELRKRA